MRRDPIVELIGLCRMLNPDRGEIVIAGWIQRYVHTCQARHHSTLMKSREAMDMQKHIDEKLLFELTSRVIDGCAYKSVDETETANIVIKSVVVIGDLVK